MLVRSIVSVPARRFRSRAVLQLENLALRHQLHVLRRQRPGRPRLFTIDRLLWVWLYRLWPRCLDTMMLVKPATVIQWHRQGFRLYWRWRSRSGRPSVDREVSKLIREMSSANPLWGAPRIHGELLKLRIEISQATVAKYMVRRRGTPSSTWRSFLLNHAAGIAAILRRARDRFDPSRVSGSHRDLQRAPSAPRSFLLRGLLPPDSDASFTRQG